MPLFPSFRRPCPFQANLSAVMDGDWCRMCGQQVHDITDWSDNERAALLRGCEGEVCVSYRVPLTSALAAAALVASSTPALAAHKPTHHASRPTPPVITLAGAPMLPPPEPTPTPQPPKEPPAPAPAPR